MSLLDAVIAAGVIPGNDVKKELKKRYSEVLSQKLAQEFAAGLRSIGFEGVKPVLVGQARRRFRAVLGRRRLTSAMQTNATASSSRSQ